MLLLLLFSLRSFLRHSLDAAPNRLHNGNFPLHDSQQRLDNKPRLNLRRLDYGTAA
jgi:hypothetical protein